MDTETFNTARRAILANARSLLHAAEKLAAEDVDHVRYHLAALCLEEVGKVSLIGMRFVAGLTDTEAPSSVEGQLEDHVKKLFWAIWGPSFGREPLTREQIEQHRGLATHIHDKRLFSLYSDADVPLLPSEKITGQEADSLVGMARVRLGMENAQEPTSLQVTDELRWFLQASDDPEKRRHIFGTKSLEKLAELGNARAWVGWLREVYQDHDAQMQVLIQKEINRTPARDRTSAKAKWRIKFRIYSHSHSIRQKALNVWNERTDFIRLNATGERRFTKNKKDEIVATISLDGSVPVGALWHFGWGIARSFSKLDFHWRCELNAFEQFWTCFRETLRASWDGESDLKAAATAALQEVLSDTTELHSHIDLGIQFDAAMPKPERLRQITLTDVIGMKLYCDLLLLKDAVTSLEKDTAPT
jgi:AbiV family abortive infection protein